MLSADQLALFDGQRASKPVYLAILGRIYNVDRGRHHYGARGGYHAFAGKDASRAFVTGDFSASGLSDDVEDFGDQEVCVRNKSRRDIQTSIADAYAFRLAQFL